jgi:hypothetical protein
MPIQSSGTIMKSRSMIRFVVSRSRPAFCVVSGLAFFSLSGLLDAITEPKGALAVFAVLRRSRQLKRQNFSCNNAWAGIDINLVDIESCVHSRSGTAAALRPGLGVI